MRFPFVTFGMSQPHCCYVRTATVNPAVTQTIIDAISRGYAVNWDAVMAYWATNPITSVTEFKQLLHKCPGLLATMMASEHRAQLSATITNMVQLDTSNEIAKR